MKGIIDRFEEGIAVIEVDFKRRIEIKRDKLPICAKEGDIIEFGETIEVLVEETERRRKEIRDLANNMWEE